MAENIFKNNDKEAFSLFPFVPKNEGIIEKRRDFLKNYSISPDYHLSILSYINDNFGLKGKRVLELGGSNIPREILLSDFKISQYIGIDYINSWWSDPNHKREKIHLLKDIKDIFSDKLPYLIFSGRVEDTPDDFLAEKFDIIISFSSIEHFGNMSLMLEKSFNVLRKNGLYFASSEPLWSSGKGHHFWISEDYNFQVTNDFDFFHLLYSKQEFLNNFKSSREIEKIAWQIYEWNGINRMTYSEIEKDVFSSSFSSKKIYPFVKQAPPAHKLKAIFDKYKHKVESEDELSIRGIQWILRK